MTPAELRERRANLGMTQARLAAAMGITPTRYENWEAGRRAILDAGGKRSGIDLAREYHVSRAVVSLIQTGKIWKHLHTKATKE